MKELKTIQWLSRIFIIVMLNIIGLSISKIMTSNNNDEIYQIAEQMNEVQSSLNQIDNFIQKNSNKTSKIIEDSIPFTIDILNKYKLLNNNRNVEYDYVNSDFSLSKRDEKPKHYIIYPYRILNFQKGTVKNWIDFYKNEYNTNASISYPEYTFFYNKLEEELSKIYKSGRYHKIKVKYAEETSIFQELENRMDTIKDISLICNISIYKDYFSSVLDDTPLSNHRAIIKVPYHHIEIPHTSLKDYNAFQITQGVQFPFEYNIAQEKIEKNKEKIEEFHSKNISFMLLSSRDNEIQDHISIGSISIKADLIFYILPFFIFIIIIAVFIMTKILHKDVEVIETSEKSYGDYYYPIPLPSKITDKLMNVIYFYLLFQITCFGLILYAYSKNLTTGIYLLYGLILILNVFLLLRIVKLLKSLR